MYTLKYCDFSKEILEIISISLTNNNLHKAKYCIRIVLLIQRLLCTLVGIVLRFDRK